MPNSTPTILIIDDDPDLCELLTEYLSAHDLQVISAHDGQQGLETFQQHPSIDLIVLDIMMPVLTGLEVLPAIRSQSAVPIIMLTGRGDDIDRIIGLEMGADDYLSKPHNPRELLARIHAILRRTQGTPSINTKLVTYHGIALNLGQRTVTVNQQPLSLTAAEFDVLATLMQHAGEVVSKDYLSERVLQRKLTAYDRAIDVHVSRVRHKLTQLLPQLVVIKTVRGSGYQFIL